MGLKYTANLPRNLCNGTFKLFGNVANFLPRWSFIPFSLFSGHKIVSMINLLMLFRTTDKCIMECITNCFAIVHIIIILLLYYFVNRIYEVEQASIVRIQAATGMKSIAPIDYGYTVFFS